MSHPQGRVYRSGDDPRIQHPNASPDTDADATGADPTLDPPTTYHGSDWPRYEQYAPNGDGGPTPTAAGPGLYRSASMPAAIEREATNLMAPVGTPVPDPAAGETMPAPGGTELAEEPADDRGGVFRNSAVMAGFNLLSRLLGYGRTVAIGSTLGVVVSNAYTTAVYSPQMLYELLMGGTLTSVVVPLLVRARKRDADRGEAFTERFVTLAASLLLAVAAVVSLAAPVMSWVLANGTPYQDLATALSYVMLPAIFLMGMSALFQAVLNTRGSFAAPTWAPILNNIVIIGFFVMFGLLWPEKPTVESMTEPKVLVLGLGFTLAMLVQVVALVPALRKVGFKFRPRFGVRGVGLREIGHLGAWALCYVAISQVGMVVVLKLAGLASGHAKTGPIVYDYGFLLMMTVNGIAAVSVMTALMPRMSAAAADRRYEDVAGYLSLGTRLSSVLLIPGTVALAVFGTQFAVVLFQHGHFDSAAAQSTGLAISMAGFGLVPFAVSQLQIFTFYALPDTRTPALVNIPVVIVKVLFDLGVWWLAPVKYVVPLLLFGNAVSFVVAGVVSYTLLRRRIGPLGLREVGSTLSRLVLAAVVAAFPAWLVAHVLAGELGKGESAALAELAAGGAALAVVYFGLAYALRVREISDVVSMVRRKLAR
ncbi:MAG: murein biosynthesis integral membrane protein MurJ [Actinocatenispora sp.]